MSVEEDVYLYLIYSVCFLLLVLSVLYFIFYFFFLCLWLKARPRRSLFCFSAARITLAAFVKSVWATICAAEINPWLQFMGLLFLAPLHKS